jgi:hypothetical protein
MRISQLAMPHRSQTGCVGVVWLFSIGHRLSSRHWQRLRSFYKGHSNRVPCRLGDEDRFALPASRAFERMFFAVREDPFDSDQPQWIAAGVTEWAVDGFWSMRSDSGAAILIHSGIPFGGS